MAFISMICPHCVSKSQAKITGYNASTSGPHRQRKIALGAFCPGCLYPIAVLARYTGTDSVYSHNLSQLISSQAPLEELHVEAVDHWPKPPQPEVPAHLPVPVVKAFIQAEKNYPLEGHEEAAGMMYRRSLELALAEKYPDNKGSLAAQIARLVKDRVLTDDLGNWATEVRLVGNDAAHALEVTRGDLIVMRAFTDAVLRYVWTLPTQVHMRRAEEAAVPTPTD